MSKEAPRLRDFATKGYPIRCSALSALTRCTWRGAAMALELCESISGEPADTGSALHAAVATWHKGASAAEALDAALKRSGEYPLANFQKAEEHFAAYTADPRNRPDAVFKAELPVEFTLEPLATDPTGEKIHIVGTLDQLRRGVDGRPYVWDLKLTSRPIAAILLDYAFQLAAYTLGAEQTLGEPVFTGGLIRTGGYFAKRAVGLSPTGVFVEAPWRAEETSAVLDAVRIAVANIRAGLVATTPGESTCKFCPLGSWGMCFPKLLTLKKGTKLHGEAKSTR